MYQYWLNAKYRTYYVMNFRSHTNNMVPFPACTHVFLHYYTPVHVLNFITQLSLPTYYLFTTHLMMNTPNKHTTLQPSGVDIYI